MATRRKKPQDRGTPKASKTRPQQRVTKVVSDPDQENEGDEGNEGELSESSSPTASVSFTRVTEVTEVTRITETMGNSEQETNVEETLRRITTRPVGSSSRANGSTSSTNPAMFAAIFGVVLLVVLFWCFGSAGASVPTLTHPNNGDTITKLLATRSGKATRRNLLANLITHIANKEPSRPLCIIAASADSGARSFGFELSKAVSSSRAPLDLKGAPMASLQPFEAMRQIKQSIDGYFNHSKAGSVVISDVDKIKAEDITNTLWEYCEDDSAPFKHGVFIFTATIPGLDECGEEEAIEAAIKQHFQRLWDKKDTLRAFDPLWIRAARLVITSAQCEFAQTSS